VYRNKFNGLQMPDRKKTEIRPVQPEPTLEGRGPGFLIRRLQQVSVSMFHAHLEPLGLTPLQATVLGILGREDGLDQLSLASRAKVDPSTMKDVLRRLEANEAITRARCEKDRRMQRVNLTSRGRELLQASRPAAKEAATHLLSPLAAAEKEALLAMIRKVISAHDEPADPAKRTAWKRRRAK
jgi:DNA-binding MarR family transcriptional regulator